MLICGGGTGGHVYPALAVAAELRRSGLTAEDILWVGTRGQMEETLVPAAGLSLRTIDGGPVAGVAWGQKLTNTLRLASGLVQAVRLIGAFKPQVLLMTGGYVNVPTALAARWQRVPIVIFLPDVEPGAAIKRLSRLAVRVGCSVAASQAYFRPNQAVVTGYPVRPEVRQAVNLNPAAARAVFSLSSDKPVTLVFGGSRGAKSINQALMAILPELLQVTQVIHISGTLTWPEVEAYARQLSPEQQSRYRAFPYLHTEMGAAFRAADLVVARAGASMLGEGPAFGLPAVLVPYPYAWRYQKVNADYLAAQGAAVRLDDALLPTELWSTVQGLLQRPDRLAAMAQAARALDRPNAAADLARLIGDVAGQSRGLQPARRTS